MTKQHEDPYPNWARLGPAERAAAAKRICVVGAESTGTTSLARALAEHYHTEWVAEFGRAYTEARISRTQASWTSDEFAVIAAEQCRLEDEALPRCNRLLICDTNAFATQLWHRRYLGIDSEDVAAIAATRRYDLYLLAGDEIPFVPDRIRDGEHLRHTMHTWFEQALAAQNTRWRLLRGTHETRMATAIAAINILFDGSAWQPPHRD